MAAMNAFKGFWRALSGALCTAAVATALAPAHAASPADNFPNKAVRLIVGFAAGGPTDLQTRVMAQWLTERLGQSVVVENRVGGGGNIATEAVIRAPADGYTVLIIATANAINTSLYPNLPFNFARDIDPVAGMGRISYIVAVHPSLPARTIPELIAYAKGNPGKINYASGGLGGSSHLSVELFNGAAGTQLIHIPYKGNTAAYADVLSGRVPLIFADRGSAWQFIQAGQLRALAVTATSRQDSMPNLPTVAETLPGFEASAWYGFGAPRGTPPEIIDKLNGAINAGHRNPQVQQKFRELDAQHIVMSPAEFRAFLTSEAVRWGKAVRDSGAKPD